MKIPLFIQRAFVPLFLVTICPPTVFLVWYTATVLDGSLVALWAALLDGSFFSAISPLLFGTKSAWTILACFAVFQLIVMKAVPGKPFTGPVTPKGNIPLYKANGIASFFVTVSAFLLGVRFEFFPATILYDNLGGMLGALNAFSLVFCLFLYFKGIYTPSSSDNSKTGNLLFDYYWGTELYPRVFGWDVKMFTNCRFGMTIWALLLLSYAAKQQELYGLSDAMIVSVALQLIYIAKFFVWETGYLRSMDIMHDRAGFMICWGCLVWLPCVYTSSSLYLVHHPIHLGTTLASLIFLAGLGGILINYLADLQRQQVRASDGKCLVWGSKPILIPATYKTQNGETKSTVLLASGWWGLSRHFHYIPELLAAFCWAVPALFTHALPYFYFTFLTVLLTHRAFRHDERCAEKYGKQWEEYCEKVPHKIIPFVF